MSTNQIVLSYRDSLLKENDVNLLKGSNWLNDNIISFYFDFLEQDVFCQNKSLLFVSSKVTQCIKISLQSQLSSFLTPLVQEQNRQFIFFAVNDHDVIDSCGGAFWSFPFQKKRRFILIQQMELMTLQPKNMDTKFQDIFLFLEVGLWKMHHVFNNATDMIVAYMFSVMLNIWLIMHYNIKTLNLALS